jgi:type II secretory pathway pseudopilin PulG
MNKQNGFSLVEGLLIVIVVGLLAFAGYRVLSKNNSEESSVESTSSQSQSAEAKESTACGDDWTTITSENVTLPEWNVTFKLKSELLGTAVCKKDAYNPQYFISTKDVIEEKCYPYLSNLSLADPVVSIWRYDASSQALGNLYIDDTSNQTFKEYYDAHKVKDSNYVSGYGEAGKYYFVGNGFYYQTGSEIFDRIGTDADKYEPGLQAYTIDEGEFSANCPHVKAGYITQFGDITSILSAVE